MSLAFSLGGSRLIFWLGFLVEVKYFVMDELSAFLGVGLEFLVGEKYFVMDELPAFLGVGVFFLLGEGLTQALVELVCTLLITGTPIPLSTRCSTPFLVSSGGMIFFF